jgi:hypothetical protein
VRYSTPVQIGSGAYPACCAMGTGSLSRGVQRQGRGVNHPHPPSAEVKERVKPYHSLFNGELLVQLIAAFKLRITQTQPTDVTTTFFRCSVGNNIE